MSISDEAIDGTRAAPPRPPRNLVSPPLPRIHDDAASVAGLAAIFAWAEASAEGTIRWYLWRKASRSRWSKTCRVLTVVLGVGGGLVPLLHASDAALPAPEWGFVLLAAAGGCVLADRLFGFSSSWMRFMRAQAVLQSDLNRVRVSYLVWLSRNARHDCPPPEEVREFFQLVESLVTATANAVVQETSAWADDLFDQLERAASGLVLPASAGRKPLDEPHPAPGQRPRG